MSTHLRVGILQYTIRFRNWTFSPKDSLEAKEGAAGSKPDVKWIREKVREVFPGGYPPDVDEAEHRKNLRDWLLANQEAVPQLVAAFRLSGVLDFIDDAGASKHAALMRLFANLLIDDRERSRWNKESPLGKLYNAIGDGLCEAGAGTIRQASIRKRSPIQAIVWCAFADGKYLGVDRGSAWPGVISAKLGKKLKFVPWVFERRGEQASTTYGEYLDALYDQLERRSDALDIVFTDIISLGELADRALIDTLDAGSHDVDPDPEKVCADAERDAFETLGLARINDLGRLVTINYHVPAASTQYLSSAPKNALAVAVDSLVHQSNATHIFSYGKDKHREFSTSGTQEKFSAAFRFSDAYFAPRVGCKDTAQIQADLRHMFLDREQDNPSYDYGLQLAESGMDHPLCPLQLASGAHATYTAFALFANCGVVRSLVQQETLSPAKHQAWQFRRTDDPAEKWITGIDILKDPDVVSRGHRAILMPDLENFESRSALFFNFLWSFVPATSLVYDHVSSAIARRATYPARWFDPCLPVESLLFHEKGWSDKDGVATLGDRPAKLDGASLSCLGGYSLALSKKSFDRERSMRKLKCVRDDFVGSIPEKSAFHLISPNRLADLTLADLSVRPVLSFWPLIDNIISDTVRLYGAALFSIRTLRSLSSASISKENQVGGAAAWFDKYLDKDAVDFRRQFLAHFAGDKKFGGENALFEILRENVRHRTIHRLLAQTQRQAAEQLRNQLFGQTTHEVFARDGMKSLLADADYISGIVRSHVTIGSFARQFVETIVAKVEALARTRHWAVYYAREGR